MIDTLRADHLGAYGHTRPTSPAFDAWAARGTLFERTQATSSWTLPSVASILTGRIPSRHAAGQRLHPRIALALSMLDSSVRPLAEILRDHGWATAAFVNNGFLHERFGVARGFEHWDYALASPTEIRRADATVDAVLRWVEEEERRPFLLLVHFFDPHMSYDPAPAVRGRFTREYEGPLLLPVRELSSLRSGELSLDEADRRFLTAAYDEELAFVDGELGRLLAELTRRGLLESSLVVVTSDHGEEFFEHGGFEHGHTAFQELLHVPLAVWGPGVRAQRVTEPVSQVDLLPTLLDALAVPVPGGLAGASLWPTLTGGTAPPPRGLLAEATLYGPETKALVLWPWKLIARHGERPRLFDLSRDPREMQDVADRFPDAVRRLERELRARTEAAARERTLSQAPMDDETVDALRALGYAN